MRLSKIRIIIYSLLSMIIAAFISWFLRNDIWNRIQQVDLFRINFFSEIGFPENNNLIDAGIIEVTETLMPISTQSLKKIQLQPVAYDAVKVNGNNLIVGGFRSSDSIEIKAYELDDDFAVKTVKNIDRLSNADHLTIDMEVAEDGNVYLIWSTFLGELKFSKKIKSSQNAGWTAPKVISHVSTYGDLIIGDEKIFIICRTGGHGQGWSLFIKDKSKNNWDSYRLVNGWGKHPAHAYIQSPFYISDEGGILYLGIHWTYDFAGFFEGAHQYQRVTRFALSDKLQYALDGKIVLGEQAGILSHLGPKYYKESGSIISNSFNMKGRGNMFNAISRLPLSAIVQENNNALVLSSLGEDYKKVGFERKLKIAEWDGDSWKHNLLKTSVDYDLGTHYIDFISDSHAKSLWIVNRKLSGEPFYSKSSTFAFVLHDNKVNQWKLLIPSFPTSSYLFEPKALLSEDNCGITVFSLNGNEINISMRNKKDSLGQELVAFKLKLGELCQ